MCEATTYRWCFVPMRKNTNIKTPDKVFVSVPHDNKLKRLWFKAARRDFPKSKSTFYCCGDHFNIPEDSENYMRYRLMGGSVRIRKGVVPHLFDCQNDRRRAATCQPRILPVKRQRKEIITEVLGCAEKSLAQDEEDTNDAEDEEESRENEASSEKSCIQFSNKSTQTRRLCYRSRQVQVRPMQCDASSNTVKNCVDAAASPMKITKKMSSGHSLRNISDSSDSDSELCDFVASDYECDEEWEISSNENQKGISSLWKELIQKDYKFYLGIPNNLGWFLPYLSEKCNLPQEHIVITLMKIKTNDAFKRFGHMFNFTESYASQIFRKSLFPLTQSLKKFIYHPDEYTVKLNLPLSFRSNFSKVEYIIDCLEIQIEKPTAPVLQSLSWSEYKKCNTLKYLISTTPDGFINFVSKGFGGRISDTLLFEECGLLEQLKPGKSVLADRGFRHIENLLKKKQCQLIRPPSVSSVGQSSKEEVILSKRVASVRIHVERVISRIREFKSLLPHSTIDHSLIKYTDEIVTIACALINLQSPIIKV